MANYFSNELQVTKDTPPAILIHANDDKGVPPANSVAYYEALQKAGVRAELHIFPTGGHGFGLATNLGSLSQWPDLCAAFIHSVTKP